MKPMLIQTVMMVSQTGQINPQYYKFVRELEALKRRVKKLDGKNIMFVHSVPSVASASMMVTDAEVDQIVTQAMYISPRAFNEKFFGGKTAPDKLKYLTGSLNRAIAKRQTEPRRRVLKPDVSLLNFIKTSLTFLTHQKLEKWVRF